MTKYKSMILVNEECTEDKCIESLVKSKQNESSFGYDFWNTGEDENGGEEQEEPIAAEETTEERLKESLRYFNKEDTSAVKMELAELSKQIGDEATLITAVDVDEDGRIDILVQNQDDLMLIYNNLYIDASLFIKSMAVYDFQYEENNKR